MPPDPEAAAYALAARLDVILALEDEAHDGVVTAIGELLGGLSVGGFRRDLEAHLAGIEDDIIADAGPQDYSAGLGGLDPDAFISGHLEDDIADARAEVARCWHAAATRILAEARVLEAA